ncbi:MAG: flavin oxidoreductase [Bacteroidia bacterium]|nr:flavin oxidoreductase [Bacteroidia bacterium]
MHYTKEEIENLSKVKRLNLINSISGIKPANLIGTISSEEQSNLAIFSSIVHLGSNPALLGFILRPTIDVPRHTYQNILDNSCYTINHVTAAHTHQAHYTSAKFDKHISEFEACGFTEEYLFGFNAPFVKESKIKMGMKFKEAIPIQSNNTVLIIGQVHHLVIPENVMNAEGQLDLDKADNAGISGLNNYYSLTKVANYPYARVHELPKFNSKQ